MRRRVFRLWKRKVEARVGTCLLRVTGSGFDLPIRNQIRMNRSQFQYLSIGHHQNLVYTTKIFQNHYYSIYGIYTFIIRIILSLSHIRWTDRALFIWYRSLLNVHHGCFVNSVMPDRVAAVRMIFIYANSFYSAFACLRIGVVQIWNQPADSGGRVCASWQHLL